MSKLVKRDSRSRALAASFGILVFVLAMPTPTVAAEAHPENMLDAALTLGYTQGNIAETIDALQAAARQFPADAGIRSYLSRAMVTIGDVDGAHTQADLAIEMAPDSASALFAKSQALLLSGQHDAALDLALAAIHRRDVEHGPGTRSALTLSAVAMLLESDDAGAAEQLLISQNPGLAGLAQRELPASVDEIGAPWHWVQALAAVYIAGGRAADGHRLSARLAPLSEDFFRSQGGGELSSASLWNLAATGAGRIADTDAIDYLERAVDAGFVLGWRYNYAQHPTLWPLRTNPQFVALLDRLESTMSHQRGQ